MEWLTNTIKANSICSDFDKFIETGKGVYKSGLENPTDLHTSIKIPKNTAVACTHLGSGVLAISTGTVSVFSKKVKNCTVTLLVNEVSSSN